MIVQTVCGKVEGVEKGGVLRFRGIPFAAAPTGDGRFRPPRPHEGWDGVRSAGEYGPMAPQVAGGLEAMLGAGKQAQSEDCLSLNVVTPAAPAAGGVGRPVLVWIHGGGFVTGAGSIPWYTGVRYASLEDAVVVSINYRLGALGFTTLPGLGEGFAGSGNVGILDQVAALEWVRDNIAAFGGDPGNVTIFGESAGGMSVGTLLAAPAAAGLFHRAIAQSGACQAASSPNEAALTTAKLCEAAGVGEADLPELPLDRLLQAQAIAAQRAGVFGGSTQLLPFQPTVDGVVLDRQPLDAVRDGRAAGVPVMAGTTAHEFTLFTAMLGQAPLDDEGLRRRIAKVTGDDRVEEILDTYRAEHPGASPDDLQTAIATDRVFRVPAEQLLEAQSAHAPTFSYRFTYETPAFGGKLKACHALDVPFTFDVADHPSSSMFVGDATDAVTGLGSFMRTAWAAFARTGDPGWDRWDADRRPTMDLGDEQRILEDPLPATRAVWG